MFEPSEEDYFRGRLPDKTYLSKVFSHFGDEVTGRTRRYITKVFDSESHYICDVEMGEVVIRQSPGGRQQVKILFCQDDRNITGLTLQRFSANGANPSKDFRFSFHGDGLRRLLLVLEVISRAELDDSDKIRFSDEYLEDVLADDEALLSFTRRYRERLGEIDDGGDFAKYLEFCERQRQFEVFERLLYDEGYLHQMGEEWGKRGVEAIWQEFFERNPWVFGLGLAPVFLSSLKDMKLEQVVQGFSIAGEGKRTDALMRTNGILGALAFVEIKTHQTDLLHRDYYRTGTWRISNEVAGAVAQCHTTVQDAMNHLRTRLVPEDKDGNPTGEEYFLYQPRSYLVAGCLDQFQTEQRTNESKFRSFELYRRNMRTPEIITFDELLERARATVQANPSSAR